MERLSTEMDIDITPYYSSEAITLYHGDCGLVKIECDLIVTDPPYGQNFVSGSSKGKWGAIEGDDDAEKITALLKIAMRGLANGRHIYVFGNKPDKLMLSIAEPVEIIWDKQAIGMGDLTLPWGPQHEKIWFSSYHTSRANIEKKGYGGLSARIRKGSVIRSMKSTGGGTKSRNHPTEKPIDILRQLIESSSCMGETVYDPFAGSGSTLIAAAKEGRSGVGMEIDERFCEIAAKRFENEV
jgi:DNA modification methylase